MSSPVKLIRTRRFEDSRGWFVETWNHQRWSDQGVPDQFVQDNHSLSRPAGTIRGIHFQVPPVAQGKLVRCTRGRIVDFAVDLRAGSPTYGNHVGAELSADNGDQLWIPVGFGHGFITMEPDTEVMYKVTAPYDAKCEGGLRWNDTDLAISWPLPVGGPVLSDKDEVLGPLSAFESPFAYDGRPLDPL